MYIPDVHDYGSGEEHASATEPFLSQHRRDGIKREIEELINEEYDRLDEFANEHISQVAAARAERFLEAVLEGDDDAAMKLLGDRGGDRYRNVDYDTGKPWAHLIHGNLFETGGIRLRRKIVEAHAELLKSERIADLEAVVDGLSQQVRELERRLDDSVRQTW
jgi:hypothetical protein